MSLTSSRLRVVSPLRGCLKATITGEVAYLRLDIEDWILDIEDWILKKLIVKANCKRIAPLLPIVWCVVPCQVETVVGALHLR